LIMECCVEFIHVLSSEANEVCTKENKKTIAPDHILKALKGLGFETYVDEVSKVYNEHKVEAQVRHKGTRKLDTLGISHEELLREQQKLFAEARTNFENSPRFPPTLPEQQFPSAPTFNSGAPTTPHYPVPQTPFTTTNIITSSNNNTPHYFSPSPVVQTTTTLQSVHQNTITHSPVNMPQSIQNSHLPLIQQPFVNTVTNNTINVSMQEIPVTPTSPQNIQK